MPECVNEGKTKLPFTMKSYVVTTVFGKSLISLSLLLVSTLLYSQYYEVPLSQKVDSSTLIVEGKIVQSTPFKSGERIYTSHLLEVYSELKGEVECETESNTCIYVTTMGGEFENELESWSHSLRLSKGQEGLFFLSPTKRPSNQPANVSFDVYSGYQGFIEYHLDEVGNFKGEEIFHEYTDVESELFPSIFEEMGQSNPGFKSFTRRKSGLFVYIDSLQLSSNLNSITFNVYVKGTWSNVYPLKKLSLAVEYNTAFFGSNIASNTLFQISEKNSTIQSQYSQAVQNLAQNQIQISLASNSSVSSLLQIDKSLVKLFKVRLPIQNLNAKPSVKLILGQQDNSFYDIAESIEKYFDFLGYDINKKNLPPENVACPEITEIVESGAGAGVLREKSLAIPGDGYFGEVTIKGCDFGDIPIDDLEDFIPLNRRIEFSKQNGDWVSPLATDYLYWTNEEIKVRVPTCGYKAWHIFQASFIEDDPQCGHLAGTGEIFLFHPDNNGPSPDGLYVGFAHFNNTHNDTEGKLRSHRRLLKALDGDDGYEFYFTDKFKSGMPNAQSAMNAVKDGFDDWRCETRVNFDIRDDYNDANAPNTAGEITFDVIDAGSTVDDMILAKGPSGGGTCPGGTSDEKETGIAQVMLVFSNNADIHWSSDGTPNSNEYDVKTIALHEVGHLHQLGHTKQEENIMFPTVSPGSSGIKQLYIDDIIGGQHVTRTSNEEFVCDDPLSPMIPVLPGNCILLDSKDIHIVNLTIHIFPNPADGNVIFNSDNDRFESVAIATFDGVILEEIRVMPFQSTNTINVAHLPKGFYLLTFKGKEGNGTAKLIKI
jgi:hypothetical protein